MEEETVTIGALLIVTKKLSSSEQVPLSSYIQTVLLELIGPVKSALSPEAFELM